MAITKLPILRAAKTAYRDLWHVVLAMPVLAGCALLIVLAVTVIDIVVPRWLWNLPVLGGIPGFLLGVLRSFLLTPIMIAAHRYILLGEVSAAYRLDPAAPDFRMFFGWLVALSAMSAMTSLVYALVLAASPWIVITAAVFIVGMVLMIGITARLSILFPAIAVGAPGAAARNAWADTKGHGFGIFWLFVVASLPLLAFVMLELLALGPGMLDRGSRLSVVDLIIGSPIQAALVILYVAIASRLFQALARRLIGEV
jgi:hypothetical protein